MFYVDFALLFNLDLVELVSDFIFGKQVKRIYKNHIPNKIQKKHLYSRGN